MQLLISEVYVLGLVGRSGGGLPYVNQIGECGVGRHWGNNAWRAFSELLLAALVIYGGAWRAPGAVSVVRYVWCGAWRVPGAREWPS